MATDICYAVCNGLSARMVLQSRVIPTLTARGLSVTAVVPNGAASSVSGLTERLGVGLEEAPPLKSAGLRFSDAARRYLFEDVRGNPVLWANHLRTCRERPRGLSKWLTAQALYPLNRVAMRLPGLRTRIESATARGLANPGVAALLDRVQPRMVVVTYPIHWLEASLAYEARQAGIPVVGQLLSWDNITSKGRFPLPPDYYLSWGPIMTGEIREYYGVPRERIWECGVAHFDKHVTAAGMPGADEVLRNLRLDPSRPYLFFGMSSPYFAPREIDIVERLAEEVRQDVFGPDMQLVVRPHPQNVVKGYMADASWLPRLQALPGPRVAVDYPTLTSGSLAWNMEESDLVKLAQLLAGCRLCLNSGSTLSIDALIHDKPVVLTAFDADAELPWWQSARRVLEYPHLAKMLEYGGVRTVRSFDELRDAVRDYLRDPSADAEQRRETVRAECGRCDGQASIRAAEALEELACRFGSRPAPQERPLDPALV